MAGLSITGVDDVRAGMRRLTQTVEDGTVFDGLGDQVTDAAAQQITTRTGVLRGSLKTSNTAQGIQVIADADHASWHNFGARSFPGRHFLTTSPATIALATARATANLDTLITRNLKD